MVDFDDLIIVDHLDFINELIFRHIHAKLEIVAAREDIDNRLGRAIWPTDETPSIIQLPARITGDEVRDSVLVLALKGRNEGAPELESFAYRIKDSLKYLEHLVLHEIAHLKNNWLQDKELECDIWATQQMLKEHV